MRLVTQSHTTCVKCIKISHRLPPTLEEIARFLLNHTNVRLQPSRAKAVGHVLHLLVTLLGLRGIYHVLTKHGLRVSRIHLVLAQSFVLRLRRGREDRVVTMAAAGDDSCCQCNRGACPVRCVLLRGRITKICFTWNEPPAMKISM